MPELKCTVQTCTHNKNFYCDLDQIVVGGSGAKRSGETCCDSFEERTADSYSNVTGEASPKSEIDCKAVECMYNKDCNCHAGKSAQREAAPANVSRRSVQPFRVDLKGQGETI